MGISYLYAAQTRRRKHGVSLYVRWDRQGFTPKHFHTLGFYLYGSISQNQIFLLYSNNDHLWFAHRDTPRWNAMGTLPGRSRFSRRCHRSLHWLFFIQTNKAYYYIGYAFFLGGPLTMLTKFVQYFPTARVGLFVTIPRAWAKFLCFLRDFHCDPYRRLGIHTLYDYKLVRFYLNH